MAVARRILITLVIGIAVAVITWRLSQHHIFFFPFVLVLGAPLYWIWNPQKPPRIQK